MISLKASRFRVSHDGDNFQLSCEEKEELIDDLIYCIQDIVRNVK